MGDVISRQDTINELKNVFDDILCCNVSVRKGLPEAVRRIEMMPSANPKTEWIPVSERLPEINTPVMLCGKYNEVIGYRRSDSDWMALSGDGWETDIEHPEDFIAWMPLPDTWKDGE